jgi:hypothetical protein
MAGKQKISQTGGIFLIVEGALTGNRSTKAGQQRIIASIITQSVKQSVNGSTEH